MTKEPVKYTKVVLSITNGEAYQATRWCKSTFGPSRPEGTSFGAMRWFKRDNGGWVSSTWMRTFYFRNARDATLFRMKWS